MFWVNKANDYAADNIAVRACALANLAVINILTEISFAFVTVDNISLGS